MIKLSLDEIQHLKAILNMHIEKHEEANIRIPNGFDKERISIYKGILQAIEKAEEDADPTIGL